MQQQGASDSAERSGHAYNPAKNNNKISLEFHQALKIGKIS